MYNHHEIEKKWRQRWQSKALYRSQEDSTKPKYYVLDMFPYPSGVGLHVGHPKGYIATDILARLRMMQGYNVLHPMGWDAFGLPAENYAIANKIHPRLAMEKNIVTFKEQLETLGLSYDWDREINTTDPAYYKWTQWIFLKMWEQGLAYQSYAPINWCPSCQTGLANEDLENGHCERCGHKVEQRPMRQWVLKITAYADRLLADLDGLDNWEESIKDMQRNWIGRKEGLVIDYLVHDQDGALINKNGEDLKISAFTTRPDTNFGATFIVAAPDSAFVTANLADFPNRSQVEKYIAAARAKTELDYESETKEKTGVPTGWQALNSLTGRQMPIYIGDFVLSSVGTGVVVGVPGHDLRDFEFAQAMSLKVLRVVMGADGNVLPIISPEQVYEDFGTIMNSKFLNGLESAVAIEKISDYLEEQGIARRAVSYKIQDWIYSRQRYWGEPIPLIHCEQCGIVGVPEDQLPLTLPDVDSYQPTGTGESPLAAIDDWVNTSCPSCGGPAKRETNTMPQWGGSCWYYLRYMDPHNQNNLVAKEKEAYWSPVDFYVGGAEHATRHLIYARFWHKFLFDQGLVSQAEPFASLKHVGLIMGEDGRKMSKRWGNVVNPDDIVEHFGADSLRIYEMFMGPFGQAVNWNTNGLVGVRKFLEKVIRFTEETYLVTASLAAAPQSDRNILSLLHKSIKKVGEDIESFNFNTAISTLMILINELINYKNSHETQPLKKSEFAAFLQILAPFAPHLSEELWEKISGQGSIFQTAWPVYDPELIKDETFNLVIQINGKLRATLAVSADISAEKALSLASADSKIKKWLEGKEIVKHIFVPGRLLNIIVK